MKLRFLKFSTCRVFCLLVKTQIRELITIPISLAMFSLLSWQGYKDSSRLLCRSIDNLATGMAILAPVSLSKIEKDSNLITFDPIFVYKAMRGYLIAFLVALIAPLPFSELAARNGL